MPLSDPKEIGLAQQPPPITPTPSVIRTPFNRANLAQSPLDGSEPASSSFGLQPPNRAGTFAQPLPGNADWAPRPSQVSPAGQTVRSPVATGGGEVESAPHSNRPNNQPQVWQPIRPSGSLTATEQASAGSSQRPQNGGSLPVPSKSAQPGESGAVAPSSNKPTVDPIDRGQQPPLGGPLIVPRIITPQGSPPETPLSSLGPQSPAANRGVQTQTNTGVSSTSDAAAPSVQTSASLGANKPAPTWQSAVPNNNQRQASTVQRQQEPSASAQTTIKDDAD